jgi:hypothetical protein
VLGLILFAVREEIGMLSDILKVLADGFEKRR